ncbi:MAG: 2-phosphosulfolactate phosphatase [Acidimicrobiia bacterium]|nr:2-phosphosulfolactate phosphatase [Acidimicrobiia bacterium]
MVKIVRSMGMVGVRAAVGPTVVIDTFRAFTTAAVAADRGVALHVLAGSTDEARRIAASFDEPVLCGEVDGVRPDDFDLGNSPWDMAQYPIDGRTLVQATSSGTRCVVAAIRAGAAPVFAAAAVTASATAQAIADDAESVTIVAAGLGGLEPSD